MIRVLMKGLGLATCKRRTGGGKRTKENNTGKTTNIREKIVAARD